MSGYSAFAGFYDRLTSNIDYKRRAGYFDRLIADHGGKKNLLLDLACGTGSLSEEMAKLGYDVIAVDDSEDMLGCAMEKKLVSGLPIQYLCQDMTKLDMFGTIDVTICALDSLNHLPDLKSIRAAIGRVNLFTEPGGLFIFDMNTPHKHKTALCNTTYVYDLDDLYCVWTNTSDTMSELCRVDIALDFFEKRSDGTYMRYYDELSEIAPEPKAIDEIVRDSGFEIIAKYDDDSAIPPTEESDKILWVCRKPML